MSTHEKQIPICHVGGSAADSEMNTRIESFELAYRMKPLTRPVSLRTPDLEWNQAEPTWR